MRESQVVPRRRPCRPPGPRPAWSSTCSAGCPGRRSISRSPTTCGLVPPNGVAHVQAGLVGGRAQLIGQQAPAVRECPACASRAVVGERRLRQDAVKFAVSRPGRRGWRWRRRGSVFECARSPSTSFRPRKSRIAPGPRMAADGHAGCRRSRRPRRGCRAGPLPRCPGGCRATTEDALSARSSVDPPSIIGNLPSDRGVPMVLRSFVVTRLDRPLHFNFHACGGSTMLPAGAGIKRW